MPWPYSNPGSYLQGAASVIDAQGRYLISTQQAFLIREQVRAAQLDNRRRIFDQHRYERANSPTLEEQREFRRQQEFWRSWNDPPLTEIWSGKALNDLLVALQRAQGKQSYGGPTVPLAPDIVQRINVTSGVSGSIGLLQQPDDLRWPVPLQRATFDQERKEIDKLAPQVVKQAAAGKVDATALDTLNQSIARLRSRLRDNVHEMSSTDYVQALRHVNQLRDSARALQSPAAANFFSAWTLTARDVGELIEQMTQKGLALRARHAGQRGPLHRPAPGPGHLRGRPAVGEPAGLASAVLLDSATLRLSGRQPAQAASSPTLGGFALARAAVVQIGPPPSAKPPSVVSTQ